MDYLYFDHNATSPVAPLVLREVTAAMAEVYGNASSIHHFGQTAKRRLEEARRNVAGMLGCDAGEIVFTSGGTESDNLAIFGTVRAKGGHVISSRVEHPAVLNAVAQLEREGTVVSWLPVDRLGLVDPGDIQKALRRDTVLVSIMHANNETGTIQPVAAIAEITRMAGVTFHSDGVQMAGRAPVNVRALGVDLYSISGHKFGAPKGVGALYVRKGVAVQALLYGGRHERERRAGTENVPGIAGIGQAAVLPFAECGDLRDRLEQGILSRVPGVTVNGDRSGRMGNTSNLRFEGIEGEAMVIALDLRGFAVSSGSACSSGAVEPSHVLLAMGMSREDARSSVRFSLGPGNTAEQVDSLIEAVVAGAAHLRRISPAVVAHV